MGAAVLSSLRRQCLSLVIFSVFQSHRSLHQGLYGCSCTRTSWGALNSLLPLLYLLTPSVPPRNQCLLEGSSSLQGPILVIQWMPVEDSMIPVLQSETSESQNTVSGTRVIMHQHPWKCAAFWGLYTLSNRVYFPVSSGPFYGQGCTSCSLPVPLFVKPAVKPPVLRAAKACVS